MTQTSPNIFPGSTPATPQALLEAKNGSTRMKMIAKKSSIAWLLRTLPAPWRNRIVPTTRKTAPICHRPQKLRSDNHCSCPQALPKQTKRQSSGTQRSLPSAQEKCFAMSRAAAPGATGGGGEPPSAASHFSEILIQGLPARRAPRATE
jgi:hypothetical protein